MIYTVTFNPSLDYVVNMPSLKVGDINRTTEEFMFPGGKGINVSLVLHNLGLKSTALGFTAGFTGQEIIRLLAEHDCDAAFINVQSGFSGSTPKLELLKAKQPSTATAPTLPPLNWNSSSPRWTSCYNPVITWF